MTDNGGSAGNGPQDFIKAYNTAKSIGGMMDFGDGDAEGGQVSHYQILKAMLPYADTPYKKQLAILLNLRELNETLAMCGEKVISMHGGHNGGWKRGLLMSVRPHLPKEKRKMADMMITMLEMMETTD